MSNAILLPLLLLCSPLPALFTASVLALMLKRMFALPGAQERRLGKYGAIAVVVATLVVGLFGATNLSLNFISGGSTFQGLPLDHVETGNPWPRIFIAVNFLLLGAIPLLGGVAAWLRHQRLRGILFAILALPLLFVSIAVVVDGL